MKSANFVVLTEACALDDHVKPFMPLLIWHPIIMRWSSALAKLSALNYRLTRAMIM